MTNNVNFEPTIQLTNTDCKITGIPISMCSAISNRLSVKAPNYWFSEKFKCGMWDGNIKFFKRPQNTFPAGLLPMVLDTLKSDFDITPRIVDLRKCIEGITLKTIGYGFKISYEKTARDYQVDAVNNIINSKVLDVPFHRGIVNIATNGGKSSIAIALMKQLYDSLIKNNKIFLFVTHSQEIAYQAKKSIESDLKIPVGFIGDGKWECSNITVALITTLSRRTKKPEFKEIVDKTIGFVADECHHAQSTTWYDTFNLLHNASIRIGLTGTIDKTNPVNEMRLYACTGDVIIKVSNDFLIKNGFSAKPLCILFTITTPELETESYRDAYKLGIIESEERLEVIRDICKKETSDNNTVLILVERIEHGQLIYEFLKDLNRNIEFINGTVDSTTRQNMLNNTKNNNIDVLISTSVLDEGVDISGINAIIYARGMVSSRKLLQGIGRGLRKKSDGSRLRFYDFIDNMHSSLLQHSLNRYHTLKNEKFDIKMIELDKYNSMSWEEIENEK